MKEIIEGVTEVMRLFFWFTMSLLVIMTIAILILMTCYVI